jgi:hypothetical protein
MMPDNVRVQPGPESHVYVAPPLPRNYVHEPGKGGSKAPLVIMFVMGGVLLAVLAVIGVLFATGHLTLQ